MTLLTKQQILNAQDLPFEVLQVPEWGGKVRIRTPTAKQRDAFESSLVTGEGKKARRNTVNARARLVGLCLVDDAGARLFTDEEVAALGAKGSSAMDRVYTVCLRLAGISETDAEELEKKSDTDPNDSLPLTSA